MAKNKKSLLIFLVVTLLFCLACLLLVVNKKVSAEEIGEIYGGEEVVDVIEKRFAVTSPTTWENGEDISLSISFDKKDFNLDYLALDITVEQVSGAFLVVRIGTGGVYFSKGTEDKINNVTAVPHVGSPFAIEQKFGHWFFIPAEFSGVIYIPKTLCVIGEDEVNVNSLSDLYLSYDSSEYGVTSTVAFNGLYYSSDIQGSSTVALTDFSDFSVDSQGNVNDDRIDASKVTAVLRGEEKSYLTCEGVEIYNDMTNSIVFGVKTLSEGGLPVEDTYSYGWALIDLGEKAFVPKDGFAFNVFCVGYECFFRVYLEDENGVLWTPKFTMADFSNPNYAPMFKDGIDMGIGGAWGCFHMLKDEIGTVYIPYAEFINVSSASDFKNEELLSSNKMSTITKIHIGMDMVHGLGRKIAIGTFTNVDIKQESVEEIIDLTKTTNSEVDLNDVTKGSILRCESTINHTANWQWTRLSEKELPDYIEKKYLQRMVEYCLTLNEKDYQPEKWKKFKNQLTVAKATLENNWASQEQIDKALKDLSNEKFNLQSFDVEKKGCSSSLSSVSVIPILAFFIVTVIAKTRSNNNEN